MSSTSKRLLFQFAFVALACLVIEVVLRAMGYAPGDLRPNWLWFQPVDSLYVIRDFYVNDKGLQVADKNYWAAHDSFYINSDGFRNKEFETIDTTKKKVLLIGDSFVWGMSAKPMQDSCFAALLQQQTQYEVINTGIPATDPAQYAEIVRRYIPALKPDYVIVFFFMGNDLMDRGRGIIPNEPISYWTNAGAIQADIDGRHFSNAQSAYNYIANEKYYLKAPKAWYAKVIAKSALLSRLYAGKFRIEEKLAFEHKRKHTDVSRSYLYAIKQTAQQYKVPVKFVVIPELKEADLDKQAYYKRYADILQDENMKQDWFYPPVSPAIYTPYPDGHLNNEGHSRYAIFIKTMLADYFKE